jgi:hypothetical protein
MKEKSPYQSTRMDHKKAAEPGSAGILPARSRSDLKILYLITI